MRKTKTIQDHIDNIIKDNGCWIWQGSVDSRGYGQLKSQGITWRAHRFFYVSLVNKIPPNYQIDHLCKNKLCVNPEHLEPVTQFENMKRSGVWEKNKGRSHCPKGHEYTPENIANTKRLTCLQCKREYNREYMKKKRLTDKGLSC